jgi:hypothetical protein
MIVIAAYNDINYLTNLLDSLNTTEDLNENVLVISTDPNQKKMIEFIRELPNSGEYNFNILVDFTNQASYDSGAYIYAYKNYIDDYYIFLQDSLTIKSPNWFNFFKEKRHEDKINPLLYFNMCWDNNEQKMWVEHKFEGEILRPNIGVFGPIFQISRKSLIKMDELHDLNKFMPSHKIIGQQGMERGWAYLSINSGIEIESIDGTYHGESYFNSRCFNKIYLNRN